MSVTSPHSSHRALFLLYRLFHLTKLFDSPNDVIATAAACFGEGLQAGGGVVFKLKRRRYEYAPLLKNWLIIYSIQIKLQGMINTIMLALMFFFKWFSTLNKEIKYNRHYLLAFPLLLNLFFAYYYPSMKDK